MIYKDGDEVVVLPGGAGSCIRHAGEVATIFACNAKGASIIYSNGEIGYCVFSEVKPYKDEKKMFKKEDIKPGMVIVTDSNEKLIVVPNREGTLVLCSVSDGEMKGVEFVRYLGDDLTSRPRPTLTVSAIYSGVTGKDQFFPAMQFRECLWKREDEIKEVTMKEVEEMFGYKVKIVKED